MTAVSQEVTVGVDIGTTSVKAVAVDGDGAVVARARIPHRLRIPAPGRMEHDATQAWRRGPRRALAALDQPRARAVCVAAMVPSMTAVDRRGTPRAPGLLYGDERGRTESSANPAASGEALAFLKWLAAEVPDAWGFWPAQAAANFALSGEAALDTGSAFTTYPLFTGLEWDAAVFDQAGVRADQLPRTANMDEAVGKVGDALLSAGTIDALGEQLVAGADADGDALVILGTTLIVWAATTEWREVPGLWTIPHTSPGLTFIGGASNAGGLFLNWAMTLAGRSRGAVDPHRVPVWLPYPRGERTPYHDPDRRALLHGLDLTHDAAAVRRAAYEASGFAARHHLDLAATSPRRIVATGGGVRVAEWVQALADCTGLPVDVVAVPEGGALGAAFIARVTAGLESTMTDGARWARTSHRVEPDPAWARAVEERYARYRQLADGGNGR
jgi:sugar (pentulose or hexulose) kinase